MATDAMVERQDAEQRLSRREPRWARINREFWRSGQALTEYANRTLLPVEASILLRYGEELRGDVLELGCGAGRVLGYIAESAHEAYGIDLSEEMVEYCRRTYPNTHVQVGDIEALDDDLRQHKFDVVLAIDNVLDVFDDPTRRRVLRDLRELLKPGGLLIFSSHNLSSLSGAADPGTRPQAPVGALAAVVRRPVGELVRIPGRLLARRRNRRRLGEFEHTASDHAIVNDQAHDYGLLHYYIRRPDQQRQLSEAGYELVGCLDANGRSVASDREPIDPWLHYVARLVA